MANSDAEVWENGIQPVGSYTNKRVTGKNKDSEVGNCRTQLHSQCRGGRSEEGRSPQKKCH